MGNNSTIDTCVLVCGHGVYNSKKYSFNDIVDRYNWLTDFPHDCVFFLSHIVKGMELVQSTPESVLIFSGGFTKVMDSKKLQSEAQSYSKIARGIKKFEKSDVEEFIKQKTMNGYASSMGIDNVEMEGVSGGLEDKYPIWEEDYSRDSFENLLFSIALFRKKTGRYPKEIKVVSWRFKENRFHFHFKTLQERCSFLNGTKFTYLGVGYFPDKMSKRIEKNELKTLKSFKIDPLGLISGGILSEKKKKKITISRCIR